MTHDLSSLKDDMTAFIEGHGMRRFRGYVTDDVPNVPWETGANPENWKDFVELAKAAGASFRPALTLGGSGGSLIHQIPFLEPQRPPAGRTPR